MFFILQATLNARTSILAAANPIGGRYDRTKSLKVCSTSPLLFSKPDLLHVERRCSFKREGGGGAFESCLYPCNDAPYEPPFLIPQQRIIFQFKPQALLLESLPNETNFRFS